MRPYIHPNLGLFSRLFVCQAEVSTEFVSIRATLTLFRSFYPNTLPASQREMEELTLFLLSRHLTHLIFPLFLVLRPSVVCSDTGGLTACPPDETESFPACAKSYWLSFPLTQSGGLGRIRHLS